MPVQNIEIKARSSRHHYIREILHAHHARYVGEDHQIDTYFQVESGRLKLRKGTIENTLIFYHREDLAGPRLSRVHLYPVEREQSDRLRALLEASHRVLVIVDKRREIYFIDNVKFHLDTVVGLGTFVEIEVIDKTGQADMASLQEQCEHYMQLFGIKAEDLLSHSYSDELLEQQG